MNSPIQDIADLANSINRSVETAGVPPVGSQLAADNEALAAMYPGTQRMMSAYVRYLAGHASDAATTMHLLLTHPATVQQGYRTPSGSLAAPSRTILEATAQVLWVTGAKDQGERLVRIAQHLAADAKFVTWAKKGVNKAQLRATITAYGGDNVRLSEPPPTRSTIVAKTLGNKVRGSWHALSAAIHYSPTWDMMLGTENSEQRIEHHRLNHDVALQTLTRLDAQMRRVLAPHRAATVTS